MSQVSCASLLQERVKQERTMGKTAFTLRVSVFVGAPGLCLWPKIFLNQPAASLPADLDEPRHVYCLFFPPSHSCSLSYFPVLYLHSCNSHIDHSDDIRHDSIMSLPEIILTLPLLRRPTQLLHVKVVFAEVPVHPRPSVNSKL